MSMSVELVTKTMSPPLMLGMVVLPAFFQPNNNIYCQILAKTMKKEKFVKWPPMRCCYRYHFRDPKLTAPEASDE